MSELEHAQLFCGIIIVTVNALCIAHIVHAVISMLLLSNQFVQPLPSQRVLAWLHVAASTLLAVAVLMVSYRAYHFMLKLLLDFNGAG